MGMTWGGFRRLRPSQHGAQGRLAQRLARNSVAPDCFHDLGRVVLLAPQLLDQPFGLASQGGGLAPGLVARLQGRCIPQANRAVSRSRTPASPPSGLNASDQT